MKSKILYFIILIFFSWSCEKKTVWNYQPTGNERIVAEGLLTNLKKEHKIKLTKTVDTLGQKPKPVSGAFVSIYNGDKVEILQEDSANPGIYKTDSSYRAVLNKLYHLQIIYQQKRYTALSRMVPVTPFHILKYVFDEKKQAFYIDSVADNFSSNESAMYQITISWSHLPQYAGLPLYKTKAKLYYYTLKTLDISELFAPEKELVYFPKGSRILERKYSLSPQHAAFIRSMLSETEWRGGFFDVEQANVYSNLTNGALGFFGVSTVISDTLTVE